MSKTAFPFSFLPTSRKNHPRRRLPRTPPALRVTLGAYCNIMLALSLAFGVPLPLLARFGLSFNVSRLAGAVLSPFLCRLWNCSPGGGGSVSAVSCCDRTRRLLQEKAKKKKKRGTITAGKQDDIKAAFPFPPLSPFPLSRAGRLYALKA